MSRRNFLFPILAVGLLLASIHWGHGGSDKESSRAPIVVQSKGQGVSQANEFLPLSEKSAERQVDMLRSNVAGANQQSYENKSNKIDQFWAIAEKVLPSEGERTTYRKYLADESRIEGAKTDLLFDYQGEDSKVSFKKRLKQLVFIEHAIKWQENPRKRMAIEAAKAIVLSENLGDHLPQALRRARAGDKIELYIILCKYAPAEAKEIYELSQRNRALRKLIQFAEQSRAS